MLDYNLGRLNRLNLFGITGAANENLKVAEGRFPAASISLESRVLRTANLLGGGDLLNPPQSLWNHGCCEGELLRCLYPNGFLLRLRVWHEKRGASCLESR